MSRIYVHFTASQALLDLYQRIVILVNLSVLFERRLVAVIS